MPNDFFLRFYDQTDEAVEECVKLLMLANGDITGHKLVPANLSSSGKKPSHQVQLVFKTPEAANAMLSNKATQAIYMKFAAPPHLNPQFMAKKPGDKVFGANRG